MNLKNVARNLRRVREAKGFTREEVETKTKGLLNTDRLYRVESGKAFLKLNELATLVKLYGVNYTDILV
jgi:transcriptional regulator with XRE-family HTH domain